MISNTRIIGESVQAKDAGDWTCEDFLKVPKSAQSRVVYYLVGLNKSQIKEFHDISAKDFNVSVSTHLIDKDKRFANGAAYLKAHCPSLLQQALKRDQHAGDLLIFCGRRGNLVEICAGRGR